MGVVRRNVLTAMVAVSVANAAWAQEDYVVLKRFTGAAESPPSTPLLAAADAHFYGGVPQGTFRFSPDGTYTLINDRGFSAGVIGTNGFLYATSSSAIFRIALTGEHTTLATFDDVDDGQLTGPLVEGDDGTFYGIARTLTAAPSRIFTVSPAGVVTTVHEFGPAEDVLFSRMIRGQDGGFYGNLEEGGTGHGTLFRFGADGSFVTVHTFTGGPGGSRPRAALLEGAQGWFYGTTSSGGVGFGTLFRFHPAGQFEVLHAFTGGEGGAYPGARLVWDALGNLHGTASGAIFRLTPAGQFRVLHRVDNLAEVERYGVTNGEVVLGADGNLYGSAQFGPQANGVIFRLNTLRSACANEVELVYQTDGTYGTLYFTQVLKSEMPALIGAWAVSEHSVDTLWFAVVPPITPTNVYQFVTDLFPPIGGLGVYSFVLTSDFRFCADWTTVDTGGGSGFSTDALRERVPLLRTP